jgi:hypothetical protein
LLDHVAITGTAAVFLVEILYIASLRGSYAN